MTGGVWYCVLSQVCDYYKDDLVARKGFQLIELANTNGYHEVAAEVFENPSVLNTIEAITKDDITLDWRPLKLVDYPNSSEGEDM